MVEKLFYKKILEEIIRNLTQLFIGYYFNNFPNFMLEAFNEINTSLY